MRMFLIAFITAITISSCATAPTKLDTYNKEVTELYKQNDTVVVMYGASWCPACRLIHPILEQFQKDGKLVLKYTDVDVDPGIDIGVINEVIPKITVYRTFKKKDGTQVRGLTYFGVFPEDSMLFRLIFGFDPPADLYKPQAPAK